MSLAQQLMFCRPAGAHPTISVAMGCPLPTQDFGFVFDVHAGPLLDFEFSEQQLCLPAYTAAPSTDFMKTLLPSRSLLRMQRVLTWQGPLGVTLLIISHLKLLMANLWAQPSRPFSTHFYSTPPVPNFPGD